MLCVRLLWYHKLCGLWQPLLSTNENEKGGEWLGIIRKTVWSSRSPWKVSGPWGPRTILGEQCIWTVLSVPLLNHTVLFWYQHTQRDALRKRSGSLALLLIVGIWGSSRSGTKGTLTLPFLEQPEETVPSGFSARRSCATSGPLVGF